MTRFLRWLDSYTGRSVVCALFWHDHTGWVLPTEFRMLCTRCGQSRLIERRVLA